MTAESQPGRMRSVATSLLAALDGEQRRLAARPFSDDAVRRWLEYRPERRTGVCLADLSGTARRAAHRLLPKVQHQLVADRINQRGQGRHGRAGGTQIRAAGSHESHN